jgi:hypothetical protein
VLCELVSRLPLDQFILLKYLCSFLQRCSEASPGADVAALAGALVTSFVRARDDDDDDDATPLDASLPSAMVATLISRHRKVFALILHSVVFAHCCAHYSFILCAMVKK